MIRSHNRRSFPAFKMFPYKTRTSYAIKLTNGMKAVCKKLHNRKTRQMGKVRTYYTAARARTLNSWGVARAVDEVWL